MARLSELDKKTVGAGSGAGSEWPEVRSPRRVPGARHNVHKHSAVPPSQPAPETLGGTLCQGQFSINTRPPRSLALDAGLFGRLDDSQGHSAQRSGHTTSAGAVHADMPCADCGRSGGAGPAPSVPCLLSCTSPPPSLPRCWGPSQNRRARRSPAGAGAAGSGTGIRRGSRCRCWCRPCSRGSFGASATSSARRGASQSRSAPRGTNHLRAEEHRNSADCAGGARRVMEEC